MLEWKRGILKWQKNYLLVVFPSAHYAGKELLALLAQNALKNYSRAMVIGSMKKES